MPGRAGPPAPPAGMTICPMVLLTAETVQIGPPDGYFLERIVTPVHQ
jgi:hypothetical protein